jgi:hypothetical protein
VLWTIPVLWWSPPIGVFAYALVGSRR